MRSHSDKTLIVQLDDLDESGLSRAGEAAFLTLQTSPGNRQAWVAVSGIAEQDAKDLARRLRKGSGADATASGATRIAGTANYKRKYEPAFPTVLILNTAPGRSLRCSARISGTGRGTRAGEARDRYAPSRFPQARQCGARPQMA